MPQQLTFEGIDIGSLRYAVQAVHFAGDRPLRGGDEVELVVRCRVDEIRFPFGEEAYEYRTHILKPTSVDFADAKREDAA